MTGIQEGMTAAQVSEVLMNNFSEVSAEADRAKTMAAAEEARAKGVEQGLTEAVAQNAGEIIALKGNSATKGELNAEAERAQSAEELISQQAEQNFKNFSDLGVEESAKMDGYEIALTKKTNTAEKTKVKVPVYDMQDTSATPVGLVDEIFVEDMKAEAKKMVDAEAQRAKAAEQDLSTEITEAENRVDERVTEVRDSLEAEVQARSADVADLNANTGISEYPTFDSAKAYAVGDVVKYEGRLYRFTAEHAAGEWIGTDAESWSERKEREEEVAKAYSCMAIASEGCIPYIVEENVYILELTGEKFPYKDWGTTNFIRVIPNTHIKVSIDSVYDKKNKYCWWYNENRQPLAKVGTVDSLVAGENTLHVPEGAYYLRISEELKNIKNMTIESFSKLDTRKQIEELIQHADDIDFNHSEGYRAFTLFNNYYVRHTGEIKESAEWVATDKFRVKDKLIVYISESTTYCCFYDANKNFLSSFTINADRNIIHIPDSAVYAAISAPKEVMKTLRVEGYFFNKYEESSKQIEKNKNKIKEHSSLLNDSIEYDFTYLKNVGKYYGADSTPNNPTIPSESIFVGIFDIAADETVKYRCNRIGAPAVYVLFYEGRIWTTGNEGQKEIPAQGFPYQIAFNCHESFSDFYLQIKGKEGIVANVEELNNKISSFNLVDNTDISIITDEIYNNRKEGFYIDKEGRVIAYNGYRISKPYPVKKGDIVEFSANGNSITFLAKTKKLDIAEGDDVDVIYFSDSSDELKKIRHQFDEDTNMIVCWNYILENVKLEHPVYIPSITPYLHKEKEIISKLTSLQSQDSIKFILHTDNHCQDDVTATNKAMVLRHCEEYAKLAEEFGLDFHINLGDVFINGSTLENKRNLSETVLKMQNSFVPFLYVLGNHEVWTGYGELDYNYVYGATGRFSRYIPKKYNELDSDKLYYYFDNDIQKIRCYVLNSSSIGYWGFSDLQIEWMSRTIDDMPNGYKIVIFTHIPFLQGAMHSTEKNSKVPVGVPTNSSTLRKMLLSKEGLEIISVINGHMHWDLVVYDNELGCPVICTTSEKFENVNTQTEWAIPNQLPFCPEREKGNYSEYAADIYNISSTSSTIDILRFGAGKSRKIHLASVNVEDSVTLASSLANPTWRTSSEDIASVSNGVVTKVASGSATIQAETDTDVEIWHILVV